MQSAYELGPPVSDASMVKESSYESFNSVDRDRTDLLRLGKKQVLKRNFGFMSMLGFSCTVLVTWEAVLIIFNIGIANGGPAGLVYGYLLVWIGTASIFATLGELASMAPTAGGQYYWVSMLAPHSSHKFFSYVTGWLTFWGWQTAIASSAFLSGTLVQGIIVLTTPIYDPKPWQSVLLIWAAIFFAILVNTIIGGVLPKFEGFVLILHILGFFALLLPLIVYGPHQQASEVFGKFVNGGGWPTQGLSCMIGLVGSVFAFGGADAAIHMSEEIHNASLVIPRSIMATLFLNGCLGFGMLLATLFSLNDVKAAIESPTGYPFMEILVRSTGSIPGAALMASLVTTMQWCANVGILASASRMCWSFARDHGLPGSRYLQHVDPRTSLPIRSIIATTSISCLLSLTVIGSSTAFNDLVSLWVASLNSSYLLASGLLLYHRCTGGILPHNSNNLSDVIINKREHLMWGPWRIPGMYGIINNMFACIYVIVIIFFSLWPPGQPVDAGSMNYSVLGTGAVAMFSVVYYFVWAKREYKGPVIEVN